MSERFVVMDNSIRIGSLDVTPVLVLRDQPPSVDCFCDAEVAFLPTDLQPAATKPHVERAPLRDFPIIRSLFYDEDECGDCCGKEWIPPRERLIHLMEGANAEFDVCHYLADDSPTYLSKTTDPDTLYVLFNSDESRLKYMTPVKIGVADLLHRLRHLCNGDPCDLDADEIPGLIFKHSEKLEHLPEDVAQSARTILGLKSDQDQSPVTHHFGTARMFRDCARARSNMP